MEIAALEAVVVGFGFFFSSASAEMVLEAVAAAVATVVAAVTA